MRADIGEYAQKIQRDVQNADYTATIDKASLSAYIMNSPLLREIRTELFRGFGLDLENSSSPVDLLPANVEELIRGLQHSGQITTLLELEDALITERKNLRNSYGPESGIQEVTNE